MERSPVSRWLRIGMAHLLCLMTTLLPSERALALVGDSEGAFGLDGSIRALVFVLDQDGTVPFSGKNEVDVLSQTILRLTALGSPTKSLSYEVHWVQSITGSSLDLAGGGAEGGAGGGSAGGGASFAAPGATRFRALDAGWDVLNDRHASSRIFFDRFNVKLALDGADLTAGRQAITFGKAYFWNPLDVFFPFDASQFDRDYKPGVDALRLDIPFGAFSGMNLVGAAGPRVRLAAAGDGGGGGGDGPSDVAWYGSALLSRFFTDVSGWDVAVQGGKVFGGYQAGGGIVGDIGPIQLRSEVARFWAVSSDPLPFPLEGDLVEDSFLGVVGMGHRFESSLSIDMEYFYNGAGDPGNGEAALVRTRFGSSLQLSGHLVGVLARYEFTPLVTGQCAVINSLSDGSTQLQPIATISLGNEMDLLVGLILNVGREPGEGPGGLPEIRSEFGTSPNTFFVEWKYYF